MLSVESLNKTIIESWFIPLDILAILVTVVVVIVAILFLVIILLDKTLHTVPMMLVANSCLAHLILGISVIWTAIWKLQNDLKRIQYQDTFCIFRAYMGYSLCAIMNHSYLLQAMYRYIRVIYPARVFFRSQQIQCLFVCLTWLYGFLCSSLFLFTGEIVYDAENQMCQLPLRLSFSMICMTYCIYIIPVTLNILIYYKLVRYIHQLSKQVSSMNSLSHIRHQLKVVRQIGILLIVVTIVGICYGIFVWISYFTTPLKYHFRTAYIFLDVFSVYIIITLLQFNKSLRMSLFKRFKRQSNMIVPRIA